MRLNLVVFVGNSLTGVKIRLFVNGVRSNSKAAVIRALKPPVPSSSPAPLIPPLVPIAPVPRDTLGLSKEFLSSAIAAFGQRFQPTGSSSSPQTRSSVKSVTENVLERIVGRLRRRIEIRDTYVAELADSRISRSNLQDQALLKVVEENLKIRRDDVAQIVDELRRLKPLLQGAPDYDRRLGAGGTLLRLLSSEVLGLSVIFELTRLAMLDNENPNADDLRVYQSVMSDLTHAEYREEQIHELTEVCQ